MYLILSQNSRTLVPLIQPYLGVEPFYFTYMGEKHIATENNKVNCFTELCHPCCKRSRSGKRSWQDQARNRCTESFRSPQGPDCWNRMDCSHHTENQKLPHPEGGTCIERLKGL